MNKVILTGRLGTDCEISNTSSGTTVGKFSLATSEKWKDAQGNLQEKTEWHRIQYWRIPQGLVQYLTKGVQVLVEGKISYSSWEQDGQKRYATDIVVQKLELLSRSKNDSTQSNQQASTPQPSYSEDDIPF